MIPILTGVTFIGTIAVVMALVYAFGSSEGSVAARLERLKNPDTTRRREKFTAKQKEQARDALASIGRLLPGSGDKEIARLQLLLTRAGYRSSEAMQAMRGAQLIVPIALLMICMVTSLYIYSFFFPILAIVLGYMLPGMWLQWRISVRKRRLRQALPDGLDLLVICVEVGLGLDQSLLRVAQELRIAHPDLSEELHLVNLEMRVGKTRIEALRELARRTGLEDIKALVAMLVQTERFGTSIAQSLRIHSDELRTKRRQRAEEMSAKTTVKMIFPLVLFIFPALIVVILGPAIITLMRQLLHP
jgi:tight adherence protein C